jgi:hypothetical protein
VFPETFSFHRDRHDPAELYLQLDDLWRKPRLLSPRARRRDAEVLVSRLLIAIPRYLESVVTRVEGEGRLGGSALARVHEEVALVAQIVSRFVSDRGADEGPGIRMAALHLRKLAFENLLALVRLRVTPGYVDAYVEGRVDPVDPRDDLSEAGFFHTLESGDADAVDRSLLRLAERAFHRWLEDVCLDESNRAFEVEESPFADRETEVRRAVSVSEGRIERAQDLQPFLRRPGNRDAMRVLGKLEGWFLRQYDVHHAAAMIHHADGLARGASLAGRTLSHHKPGNYLLALALLAAPFLGAALAYGRAPRFFDALCAAEVALVDVTAAWFLLYRFCWRRDLTVFRASVPRIAAGIIVGYLPIFFLDEVWALAARSWSILGAASLLLGFTTLLYLYIEVQRRLGDTTLAFARARQIFLLGVLQAFGIGLLITGLIGPFMAIRNWSGDADTAAGLGSALPAFVGELPRVIGIEPFLGFPSAVFVMTFLSFFIGTFLQLLWEDIPITEPL